jgi:hypothetical protein
LQIRQLFPGVVKAIDLRKRLQPGLTALLPHDAPGSPGRQTVIEALVSCSHSLQARVFHARVIKTCEIAHAVIRSGGHYPRVTSVTQDMREATIVLEEKERVRAERGVQRVPVDGVGKIDVEVGDDRLAVLGHVSG